MLQVTAYMSLQSEQAPKYVRGEVSRHQLKFHVSSLSLLCTILGIFHLPETLGNFTGKARLVKNMFYLTEIEHVCSSLSCQNLRWWQKYCHEISLELMNPYENLLMKHAFSESFIVFFIFFFLIPRNFPVGCPKNVCFSFTSHSEIVEFIVKKKVLIIT